MTCPASPLTVAGPVLPVASPAAGSRRNAFLLLASVTVSFLAGSSAPTPLYAHYQAAWGFSAATVTAVFASYAVVLLASLLVFGRLSDHLGRKPVIVASALLQVGAMAVFATADGVAALFAARIVQGIATGAAIAAVGAGMLDLDRERGTIANAVAPAFGTAAGAVLSGLMVRYLPHPTLLVYAVLAAVYLLQAAGIAPMPEPGRTRAGALASLRPQLGAQGAARDAVRLAVPMLVAGWAVAGFYASLGPALVRKVFGLDPSLAGGLALFALAGSAGLAVAVLRASSPQRLSALGGRALALGMAAILAALVTHSAIAYFAATVLTGVGFGSGFQGGVRSVLAVTGAAERASVLSVVFVVAYLAMGLPAVGAGLAVVRTGDLVGTALVFGTLVLLLAATTLRGQRMPRQPE
ncbi:MAG TPA: MFS transporter [Ramlibacter sp.]